MTDDKIAPLMASTDHSEENDNSSDSSKNYDNNDELINLLNNNDNNRRENININNNNIRNNNINFNFNNYHKKSLIFFSFSIQVLIYYILLQIYFDKSDFLKKYYDDIYSCSVLFAFLLFMFFIKREGNFRNLNTLIAIILSLTSSILMFFFLYKLGVVLTFQVLKSLMLVTIIMYLNLSLVFFYYSMQNMNNLDHVIFLSTAIVCYFFCYLFYYINMISFDFALFDFFAIYCLSLIAIFHLEFIFDGINIRLKHYPIINLNLFIDVFLLSLFVYLMQETEKNRKEKEIKNAKKIKEKNKRKK